MGLPQFAVMSARSKILIMNIVCPSQTIPKITVVLTLFLKFKNWSLQLEYRKSSFNFFFKKGILARDEVKHVFLL